MNNTLTRVPPGFRFHPTDEELVDYYLRKKVANKRIDLDVIKDIDLYKIEPWDLQEKCKIGSEEQTEWYFFSHKDKKYPTGTRTNRATTAGFWKATGRDKAIYSKLNLIGMRKTLVFYKGRAPNGQKSDWIMHEYRLETNENATPQEEGWVVCRVFKKRITTQRKGIEGEAGCWYDDQVGLLPELDSPRKLQPLAGEHLAYQAHSFGCKQELDLHYHIPHDPFLHLPQLESPKVPSSYNAAAKNPECSIPFGAMEMVNMDAGLMNPPREDDQQQQQQIQQQLPSLSNGDDHVTDWRVLDKFVASQLSQEDVSNKEAGSPRFHSDNLYPIPDMSLLLKQSTKQHQQQQNNFPSNDVDLWSFAGK